jgi:hypothetical protein
MKKTTLVLFCMAYFISLDVLAFSTFKKKHLVGIKSVAIVSVYTNVPYLELAKQAPRTRIIRNDAFPDAGRSHWDMPQRSTNNQVQTIKKPVRLDEEHLPELHQYILQSFTKVFRDAGWTVLDHSQLMASTGYKKFMAGVYDRSQRTWWGRNHDWLPMQGMTVYQINKLYREDRRAGAFSKELGVDAVASIECGLKFRPYNAFGGLGSAVARTRCRVYMVTDKGKYAIYGINVNRWHASNSKERVKMYDGEINVGPEKSKRMMKQALDQNFRYYAKKISKTVKK